MSYCLNPHCQNPDNVDRNQVCQNCGANLLLKDRYLAIKLIGQGGFGKTYLAIDRTLPGCPPCVIKQFLPQAFDTGQAMMLFEQEAVRLKELGEHEQIPALFDYLEQNGCHYLVQEFIDGENLAQELAQSGNFSETQIRKLLSDLLPVLQFVHERQVIHRDIKPQNIIRRTSDRKLCLADFGAAKLATGTALLKTGTLIGSAAYVAPEQLMGRAVFASDLYSLGVTCIHLLTQIDPFECYSIAEGNWVWRDYLHSPISQSLGAVLDTLLSRGTSRRYASAAAVLQDLNPVSPKAAIQPYVFTYNASTPKAPLPKPATVQHSIKPSQGTDAKEYATGHCFSLSFQRSIATLLLLGAGGAFWNIPFAYQAEAYFKAHAVLTTGVVENTTAETHWVSTGVTGGYPRTTYTSTVKFETLDGEIQRFSSSSVCDSRCKNIRVNVLYDPAKPSNARIGTDVHPVKTIVNGLFFGGLLLLWGSAKMGNLLNSKTAKSSSR